MAHLVVELPRGAVKTRIKILILVPALLVGLPALAWTATFLYWHLRITHAIRILETRRLVGGTERTPELSEAAGFLLTEDNCRPMPYLIAALHPSQHREFLNAASFIIADRSVEVDGIEMDPRVGDWAILPAHSPEEVSRRIKHLQGWWSKHGSEHHPWWRVWSGKCR